MPSRPALSETILSTHTGLRTGAAMVPPIFRCAITLRTPADSRAASSISTGRSGPVEIEDAARGRGVLEVARRLWILRTIGRDDDVVEAEREHHRARRLVLLLIARHGPV